MGIRLLSDIHSRQAHEECGSTLTEFSIVAPLLLLFVAGLLALGQLLVNTSFMSQTSFLSAMSVAETPITSAPAAIQAEADRLKGFEHYQQIANSSMAVQATYSAGSQTGKPILNVSMRSDVTPLFGSQFHTTTKMFAAFGVLLPDPSIFTSLNDFENPPSNPCSISCPTVDVDDTKPIKTVDQGGMLSPADQAQAKINMYSYIAAHPELSISGETCTAQGCGGTATDLLTKEYFAFNCTPGCTEYRKPVLEPVDAAPVDEVVPVDEGVDKIPLGK